MQAADLSFIRDFAKDLRSASGAEQQVLDDYAARLLAREDGLLTDAHAMDVVTWILTGQHILISGPHSAAFTALVDRAKSRTNLERARLSTAICATLDQETVQHYGWLSCSIEFMRLMIKVLRDHQNLQAFVQQANCVLLLRHIESRHNARVNSIGYHSVSSKIQDPMSPLEIVDLRKMLSLSSAEKQRLLKEMTACNISCGCLRGHSVRYDRFGLLVPAGECACQKDTSRFRRDQRKDNSKKRRDRPQNVDEPDESVRSRSPRVRWQQTHDLVTPDPSDSESQTTQSESRATQFASSPADKQQYTGPVCSQTCRVCPVPLHAQKSSVELHQIAQLAFRYMPESRLPGNGIHFAACGPPGVDGVEVHQISAPDFLAGSYGDQENLFLRPALIYGDAIRTRYTCETYLSALLDTYRGLKISMSEHGGFPRQVSADELVSKFNDGTAGLNALSIPDIAQVSKSAVFHHQRFTLLQQLIHRAEAVDAGRFVAKPTLVHTAAVDLRSCLSFNVLASQGAYSGWHIDCPGGTWLQWLFGRKLWFFSPCMADDDAFHSGEEWQPAYAFAVVVDEDVQTLFIPAGWRHAVLTLEPAAMAGGMVMDRSHCETALRVILDLCKHRDITNEPLAYQLPQVVAELSQIAQHWKPQCKEILALCAEIAAQGCKCGKRCSASCPCNVAGRRCLTWCIKHPDFSSGLLPRCMDRA